MNRSYVRSVPFVLIAMFALIPAVSLAEDPLPDNQLSAEEEKEGWQLLFNGKDHTGWKTNEGEQIASKVEEGALQAHGSGGYLIIHEKQFGDFVLKCDVKMSEPRCNSGIFLRVGEPKDPVYTGFEIQIQTGEGTGMHDFGSIYDLVPPSKNASKGAGEWNHVEIRCDGPLIAVKVNGEDVAKINVDEFDKPGLRPDGSEHKFRRAIKDFAREGYIGFQDHGQPVWFKNVKVLELKK
jgi:hypothetical protein